MNKKYIFFDFNGTILNDVWLGLKLINDFLNDQNKPNINLEKYKMIFGFPIKQYYLDAGLDFSNTSFEEMALIYNDRYMSQSLECKLFDDVIDTLKYLKNKGCCLICLSSTEYNNLVFQLKYYNIYDLFDYVIGTSNYEGGSKSRLGYNFVRDNNIDSKECLVVGDTLHDLEVANLIGCDAVLFTKGHQDKSRLKKHKMIDNLSEIKEYI